MHCLRWPPEIRRSFGVCVYARCCRWFALIWLNDFLSGILDKYKINRNYSTDSLAAATNAMAAGFENDVKIDAIFGNSYLSLSTRHSMKRKRTDSSDAVASRVYVEHGWFKRKQLLSPVLGGRESKSEKMVWAEWFFHLNSDFKIQIDDSMRRLCM